MKGKLKKEIEDKLLVLKKSREDYISQVKAINGAIQVLEELLNPKVVEVNKDG